MAVRQPRNASRRRPFATTKSVLPSCRMMASLIRTHPKTAATMRTALTPSTMTRFWEIARPDVAVEHFEREASASPSK